MLSERLQKIADSVLPGERVIDVGTDHGYIPIWLVQERICEHVYASDIREKPLKQAMQNAEKAGLSDHMTFFLCDGLQQCPPDVVDTVLIAGMGGETMISILDAAPWTREKRLILQPQSKIPELHAWLYDHGYMVVDASLVREKDHIYVIWICTGGEREIKKLVDHYVDPCLLHPADPLLDLYLRSQSDKLMKQYTGLISARQQNVQEIYRCIKAYSDVLELRADIETGGVRHSPPETPVEIQADAIKQVMLSYQAKLEEG